MPKVVKKGLKPGDYVHLHNHTHYSLLDGLQKIPDMLDRVKELGMSSVAITDHGTMSGAIEFYNGAKDRGINPIIGMETYVATRKHTDKDPQKDKNRYHLVLLAMNNKGYENLMRLSTIANLEGFYHKPRVDHDLLEKYNEGLIVLTGCMGGELSDLLINEQPGKAKETAEWYKQVFGDRYYIELQDHGHVQPKQDKLNKKLIALADDLKIPIVVTSDAHYLKHEDKEAHEILLCVQTGSYLTDTNRMTLKDWDLFVSDPKDVIARWQSTRPDAVSNTKVIADRCKVELELGKILIPTFPTPKSKDEQSYLLELVFQGLAWRYGKKTKESAAKLSVPAAKKTLSKEVLDRAEYELGVINSMGFNGYFLIVWDFCAWGKNQDIVFGPGRGSAAGSIVAYALRITEIDPLPYDLIFERFLNPDRISMPDIDIDIQDTRRDEVIQYVTDKYGADRVANIVTFGKMAARNAVRDVARVLQVPYAEADRLSKMIPPPVQGRHIPLIKSLEDNKELKDEYKSNENSKRVFDMATRLEGTIRSHGVHAAGVVIAPDDIVKFTPLEMSNKGVVATQYSMNPIEDLGLLKMDFLGLSNLTIIKNTLRIVKKVYGENVDIDNVPLDDKKTFELLSRGETTGVFQLESGGMKQYLKRLKPSVFEDIAAMTALYRPGPLTAGLTDAFINRKNGVEEIKVPHKAFEKALSTTYGTLVYQEQVMQISRDVCGFTGGESDTLRKAIGKKIREVMSKMERRFIDGGVEHSGVPKEVMESFWQDLLGFADYAFNKSHSVCYGYIAYQTAYLKAHYPAAFMAALMTSDADNTDRLSIEISECQTKGIEVLPPDINESYHEFSVVKAKEQIRFGLDAVKNVGHGAVAEIIRAREDGGEFVDINDFIKRVNSRVVNRKTWESLIKAGAFDRYENRGTLLNSLEDIIFMAQKYQKEQLSGQTDLFGEMAEEDKDAFSAQLQVKLTHTDNPEMPVILAWERELLGLYLSEHPLSKYRAYLEQASVPAKSLTENHDGYAVTVGGLVQEVRTIITKKGQPMAFVKLEDIDAEIEIIVFPGAMEAAKEFLVQDKVLLVTGKVNATDQAGNVQDSPKVIADSIIELNYDVITRPPKTSSSIGSKVEDRNRWPKKNSIAQAKVETSKIKKVSSKPQRLYIKLESSNDGDLLKQIKTHLDQHVGEIEAVFVIGDEPNKQILRLPQKVDPSKELITKLSSTVGEESIKLT